MLKPNWIVEGVMFWQDDKDSAISSYPQQYYVEGNNIVDALSQATRDAQQVLSTAAGMNKRIVFTVVRLLYGEAS